MKNEIWNFKSESTQGKIYTVQQVNGNLVCNCPAYIYNKDRVCRHTRLVENNLAVMAVCQEPELIISSVADVTPQGDKILVPCDSVKTRLRRLKAVVQLRHLGISKRNLEAFFKESLGSDKSMEQQLAKAELILHRKRFPLFPAVRW